MFSVASIGPVFNIKDEAFIKINKNYLVVNKKNNKVNDFLEYEKEKDINYILPGDSNIKFLFRVNDYYQTSLPNVFACGNIVTYKGKVKNIITGLGEVSLIITKIDQIINPTKNIPIHF